MISINVSKFKNNENFTCHMKFFGHLSVLSLVIYMEEGLGYLHISESLMELYPSSAYKAVHLVHVPSFFLCQSNVGYA